MKTLVIHPKDKTTDFLKVIYENRNFTEITNPHKAVTEIIAEIKNHDRIIILGHGTSSGLFRTIRHQDTFMIDHRFIKVLNEKETYYIWCHANQFVKTYKLRGFYTGMIISEVLEACNYSITATQEQVNESNKLLTEIIATGIEYGPSSLVIKLYNEFRTIDNPVIEFNQKNFFSNFHL